MALGLYISVPFCRAKCSFCNFASGIFAQESIDAYLDQVAAEMRDVRPYSSTLGLAVPNQIDTIYLGGGTPSLLEPAQISSLFGQIRQLFHVEHSAESTVECAPGQMTDAALETFQKVEVNRLSFGVQSFVDRECAAVGRTHTGADCRSELRRMQAAGIKRLGIDLIVGLPHQTEASLRQSVDQAVESGVEHVSLYMLEVDEGSRLGRESLLGGVRYGAPALPPDDRIADWYAAACEQLDQAGIRQYEISNFAREGGQSRHNRRYWERADYLGFGLDAHSMLRAGAGGVRWAYGREMNDWQHTKIFDHVDTDEAFEEALFLGLRLVEGVSLPALRGQFGGERVAEMLDGLDEMVEAGLCGVSDQQLWLTPGGRMASNEVFGRLLLEKVSGEMMIDLRSDTVTKPTQAMRQAMANAEVGDDVYGEDPTINRLEGRAAALFEREAAIFVPTGTMGNTIAARIHTQHGQEVICESRSHILDWEMAMVSAYCGCVPRVVTAERGIITWAAIQPALSPKIYYRAQTGLIWCENTANIAGGTVMPLTVCEEIWAGAKAAGLPVHLDGARVFNAATALGLPVAKITSGFDTVMFCLSKGLGAPSGSMLVGSRACIDKARVYRKALGGGMRQAGVLAAAGLIALEEGPALLAQDHANARLLAEALAPYCEIDLEAVQTNILIFKLPTPEAAEFCGKLKAAGVIGSAIGPSSVRLVTHRDVSRQDCEQAAKIAIDILAN